MSGEAEPGSSPATSHGPLLDHRTRRAAFEAERVAQDKTAARFSMVQLTLFLASAVLVGSGLMRGSSSLLFSGFGVFGAFLVVYFLQSRFILKREAAAVRRDVHDRHVKRMTGRLEDIPGPGATIPPGHPYASDLDIIGPGSLLARIDTTHTADGAKTIASWLASPAPLQLIARRQEAVQEFAGKVELRRELEAAVLDTGRERLDAGPFVKMMEKPGLLEAKPWLRFVGPILPLITVTLSVGDYMDWLPGWLWVGPLLIQMGILRITEPRSREVYEAMGEKKGFVDAYARLFSVIEGAGLESGLARELHERLTVDGALPSVQLKRLERWTSWYELRATGIVHVFVNPMLLWDLNCLIGIERWIRTVGRKCGDWFEVIGDLEALAALSVLLHQDLYARMPEVVEEGALEAEQVAHPLIPSDQRVANDVALPGSGSCMIVTGSNMAGKSTLLRAVGVNIALALAGGPVVATKFRVPRVRLRASMRIADSLQSGASYFQAELMRLRLVVSTAENKPPIFFLLDELLRGTNARARHLGGRAVVQHLLDRSGMGLVATHDVALSELEDEREHVRNVHFTDVIEDGVMTFDYRLRDGVVRTSNALRLLAQVGIEVEDDAVLTPKSDREAQAIETAALTGGADA
ncbi:MAG: hypothetical protein AB8I08_28375 [Sandaracinaceae bacterium]